MRAQQFLLHTAYLPEMTTRIALELCGDPGTDELLASLTRNNYFVTLRETQPEPVYQYHPMLRDFLQARAGEALAKERRRDLQRLSARRWSRPAVSRTRSRSTATATTGTTWRG